MKRHCFLGPKPTANNSLRLRLRFSKVRPEDIFSDIVGEIFWVRTFVWSPVRVVDGVFCWIFCHCGCRRFRFGSVLWSVSVVSSSLSLSFSLLLSPSLPPPSLGVGPVFFFPLLVVAGRTSSHERGRSDAAHDLPCLLSLSCSFCPGRLPSLSLAPLSLYLSLASLSCTQELNIIWKVFGP